MIVWKTNFDEPEKVDTLERKNKSRSESRLQSSNQKSNQTSRPSTAKSTRQKSFDASNKENSRKPIKVGPALGTNGTYLTVFCIKLFYLFLKNKFNFKFLILY